LNKNIFITGASGLLGKALVTQFLQNGFTVYAHYSSNTPIQHPECKWLQGDFSTINSIRQFLEQNRSALETCSYLINNYGPITSKKIPELTSEDFYFDYHHNLITTFEITSFFIRYAPLKSVINVGFEFASQLKAYKQILPYACAKNAVYTLTLSLKEAYPHIRFEMVFPSTIEGAALASKNAKTISPIDMAKEIFNIIDASGGQNPF